jgi:hypothetical protein
VHFHPAAADNELIPGGGPTACQAIAGFDPLKYLGLRVGVKRDGVKWREEGQVQVA